MINAAGSLRPLLRPHSSHLATEIKTLIKESCSCESSDNSETLNSKDIPTNSPQRLCITAEPWDKWEHNAAFGRPYSCTREPLREPTVTCVHPVPALKKPRTGAAAHLTGGCELLKQSHRSTTARVGCTLQGTDSSLGLGRTKSFQRVHTFLSHYRGESKSRFWRVTLHAPHRPAPKDLWWLKENTRAKRNTGLWLAKGCVSS